MPAPTPQDPQPEPRPPKGTSAAHRHGLAGGALQLVLQKDSGQVIIRYRRGEELAVLSTLEEMARDPESDVSWFDAALLTHQVSRQIADDLKAVADVPGWSPSDRSSPSDDAL